MENMLKKFKLSLENLFETNPELKKVDFTNHQIEVSGHHYLLCKALIPSIPEILAVESSVYQGQLPWDYEAFSKELSNDISALYLIIRDADQLVAFAGCNFKYGYHEAHITNIAVMPTYQDKGLGTVLLQTLFEQAVKKGCQQMSLEVKQSNQKAQKLYEKLGFNKQEIKFNYYANQENAYFYRRSLNDVKVKREWI